MLRQKKKEEKKTPDLFLDQDVDSGVYCQMTNRIQKILCDFVCSCKWKTKAKNCYMLILQWESYFFHSACVKSLL